MFEDADIISCYTWDNAIEDGIFIEISEVAKRIGFKFPTAITSNLFYSYIEDGENTNSNLERLLKSLKDYVTNNQVDSYAMFKFARHGNFDIDEDMISIFAVIEGRSPNNPEPIMTIMLPEDR